MLYQELHNKCMNTLTTIARIHMDLSNFEKLVPYFPSIQSAAHYYEKLLHATIGKLLNVVVNLISPNHNLSTWMGIDFPPITAALHFIFC